MIKSSSGKATIRYEKQGEFIEYDEYIEYPDERVLLEADYLARFGDEEKGSEVPHTPSSLAVFKWGARDGEDFTRDVENAYEVVCKWKKNVFDLPKGAPGKSFTQCMIRLNDAFANGTPLQHIAMKAKMLMPALLLSKPHQKSKPSENRQCLLKRLELWKQGDIGALLSEGKAIQSRMEPPKSHPTDVGMIAKRFAEMLFNGNGKGAMRLASGQPKGGVLSLDEKSMALYKNLHPAPEPADPAAILSGDKPEEVDPIVFSALQGELIKKCALRTEGAAGVSQGEDRLYRRMATCFKDTSSDYCNSLAAVARRYATELIEPSDLSALLANRGIPLNKNPGLRPIGIGEIERRIMGKAIMEIVGKDVQAAAGSMQLCAGQSAGVEAAIHAMRQTFAADATDGVLLVDADNAFNRVNRELALLNIEYVCPILKYTLTNTYRFPSRIFVLGGHEFASQEGTTQGCPFAMAMYALAISPMIVRLRGRCTQAWFADDGTGAGKLAQLRDWWDELERIGPQYGYFPKATKTWLIVKEGKVEEAEKIFQGTKIQIASEGMKHLGAAIGSGTFKRKFLGAKVQDWAQTIEMLSQFARTEPHAAFAGLTHYCQRRWSFTSRTVGDIAETLQPLEDSIRTSFLPALLGYEISDIERDVFALPARDGGLGIHNPTKRCSRQFQNSVEITKPLLDKILNQEIKLDAVKLRDEQQGIRLVQKLIAEKENKTEQQRLKEIAPAALLAGIKASSEPGASSWLTAIPSHDHQTILAKGDFRDAMCLRTGREPKGLPTTCGCGERFNAAHSMTCMRGGFRGVMHNEVQEVIYYGCKEAGFTNVVREPVLQKLDGEKFHYASANSEDEARSDIAVVGFWGKKLRRAFFDVTVFSTYARSNQPHKNSLTLKPIFEREEKRKYREYKERILQVEHADFTPLVFASTGGMGFQARIVIKRIALLIAEKRNHSFSMVIAWLRCRLSFALLRTSLLCLRGSRPRSKMVMENVAIDLAVGEANMGRESN